ncbi:hypothetical protein L198_07561 [Cryptococcus wingfieldii CBS 7118]|uniref:Uncharacterized protein n=1 Tax=Cryptococcus wingfieldii CBS 7118 TaxID=1295528 RepID=A0A1E3IAI7_9TREE|nr:hypothetical protein L198_07561 [Cryptococcus wingfieldii CBS 7118]ODN85478.1 hypothetical protein L198_07561 [Cryptococcus wingfieldii CBS 7118]
MTRTSRFRKLLQETRPVAPTLVGSPRRRWAERKEVARKRTSWLNLARTAYRLSNSSGGVCGHIKDLSTKGNIAPFFFLANSDERAQPQTTDRQGIPKETILIANDYERYLFERMTELEPKIPDGTFEDDRARPKVDGDVQKRARALLAAMHEDILRYISGGVNIRKRLDFDVMSVTRKSPRTTSDVLGGFECLV